LLDFRYFTCFFVVKFSSYFAFILFIPYIRLTAEDTHKNKLLYNYCKR
uniref:Ovule protein n=1 Tax=Brugia timori TaxID=42155 RepID=A0A0R3QCF7_9BILA